MNELISKVIKTTGFYQRKLLVFSRSIRFKLSPIALEQPVFVIGCSRAGTTLVYKTLSESKYLGTLQKETHGFWAALHPIEERNWASHEIPEVMASDSDIKQVSQLFYTQTGQKRIVDKNNQNGLSIPYLIKLFPDAHFIYIKRNPGDNINSLIQGWNKADEFATWSDQLPEEISIDNGKNKRWCFFLAKGWQQYITATVEEVCAFQYKSMNEMIIKAKQNVPVKQWHEVSYEVLINNPVEEFKKIFQGCDLPFDRHLEQHCRDVLQKPYNTFSEIRVNKWKDGSNKAKIEQVLASVHDIAEEIGYKL